MNDELKLTDEQLKELEKRMEEMAAEKPVTSEVPATTPMVAQ